MGVVKRQHYVWRAYLRPWADKERIWTYLKEFNRVERINLMGVGQERYFYELADYTEEEEKFLENMVDQLSPPVVKPLTSLFFTLFTSTSKLKRQLAGITNPAVDKVKAAEEIRKLEINLMEEAYGKIENMGSRLIAIRTVDELKTIEHDDYILDAVTFLCFQYFRTKNMKKSAISSFADGKHEDLAKRAWNIWSFTLATTLAYNVSLDPKLRFIVYENTTTEHFLTCDQPIFNILNDDLNDNGEVKSLEFYYPLSPTHALTLHFRDDQAEKYVAKNADADEVTYFNARVVANADFGVYADAEQFLISLKKQD